MNTYTLMFGTEQQRRESYLRQCLREIERSYRQGDMSRERYLELRREERSEHRRQWDEEDNG